METVGTTGAARILGLSEGRIRQLAASGALPVTETPLGRLFARAAVDALAAERERQQRERVHARPVHGVKE